ncbi:protein unc-50 homolog isoform X1 [Salvia splendens]|uniref:protein unc-50 homolog isoform X1 n=1 Tax=Salvia splendens TaxID=180675 RepID=UPI001C25CDCC|nr:protein unc-50 homolog isoform X1 [Salvia splendens]
MLPTASTKGRSGPQPRPNLFFPYLRRIVKWQQMDIEYTFWQMLNLCTSPKVVYQHTKYHKQTKNQWARDDPAFVVICSLLFSVALIAYCAAYDHSAGHAVFVVISSLFVHFFLIGAILATFCWFFTNNYLREEAPHSYVVEQRVEWLYAFDVHCNSFFPMFVLLYVLHYFLSPLLVAHGFIPLLLSNVLFMVAVSYYHYINYLGYDVLPFLVRTTVFLYPIGVVLVLSPILCLSGYNPSRYFMNMYFSQRQYIS